MIQQLAIGKIKGKTLLLLDKIKKSLHTTGDRFSLLTNNIKEHYHRKQSTGA